MLLCTNVQGVFTNLVLVAGTAKSDPLLGGGVGAESRMLLRDTDVLRSALCRTSATDIPKFEDRESQRMLAFACL